MRIVGTQESEQKTGEIEFVYGNVEQLLTYLLAVLKFHGLSFGIALAHMT